MALLGRVRPALHLRFLTEVRMDTPGRLFLCARCRVQVVLCSHCDRGNRYCSRPCWRLMREAARRDSAGRYQRSRRGRLAHAERSRRWRQRLRSRGDAGDDGSLQQNVTHQGCPPVAAAAPLVSCLPHTPQAPEPELAVALTSLMTTAAVATAAVATAASPWLCRRCAAQLPGWVRQGFVRHGPRLASPRWRHDHSP